MEELEQIWKTDGGRYKWNKLWAIASVSVYKSTDEVEVVQIDGGGTYLRDDGGLGVETADGTMVEWRYKTSVRNGNVWWNDEWEESGLGRVSWVIRNFVEERKKINFSKKKK